MDMNQTMDAVEEMAKNPTEALDRGKAKVDRFAEKASSIAPSNAFVIAALASIAVSAYFQLRGKRHLSLFVGEWAPSFLLFGIYNKLTKTLGSD
jgi:hypothetical protein